MSEDFSQYNGEGTILRKAQLRLLEMLVEVDRICRKHNITYWLDGGSTLGAVRHGGFIPWDDDIDIALLRKDYLKLLKILPQELPDNLVLQNLDTEPEFHMLYSRVADKNSLVDYGENRLTIRKKFKCQGLFLDIFYIEKGTLRRKKIIDFFYYRSFRFLHPFSTKKVNLKRILSYAVFPFSRVAVGVLRIIEPLLGSEKLIFGYGIPFKREFRRSEILPVQAIMFEGRKVSGPSKPHAYLRRYFGNYKQLPPPEKRQGHASKITVLDH